VLYLQGNKNPIAMEYRFTPVSILTLCVILLFGQCSSRNTPAESSSPADNRLGNAHLDVTGSEDAIPHFEKGLLLLHSFEYADAREAFQEAQSVDSSFAMAYWGEAMTYHHPLWRQQNYAEGQAALNKLAPSPEERLTKVGTGLERDLLRAVEQLYGEEDKFERDRAYAKYMGELYEKYEGNQEVAAFYALSLLGSVPVGRNDEVYGQAARIAEGVIAENPNHPGALHYLIHSYDDPVHAHLAKTAADSYADVAPDAAHALHMPSHIYVALGMWGEVVASNVDSYEASVKRMERKELSTSARSYHAFHWLMYGYLQQEKFEEAQLIMEDMDRYTKEDPTRGARSYLINMKGNYLVETGRWDSEIADIEIEERDDLNIATRAAYYFTEGMKAYQRNQPDTLRAVIKQLESEREQATYLVSDSGVPMCSSAGSNRSAPNKQDLGLAEVMEMELRALEARSRQNDKEAEAFLRKAVEVQEATSYDYGPPTVVYPAYELYADWLLEKKRHEEAILQYDYALERGPKRMRALKGKMQAARALGQRKTAAEIQAVLDDIARRAKDDAEQRLSLR